MRWNIINEIRRMESKYHEKTGHRGEIICLDTNAEARLTAYFIHNLTSDENDKIEEILECGIRQLSMKLCGMNIRFDCSSFCISSEKMWSKNYIQPTYDGRMIFCELPSDQMNEIILLEKRYSKKIIKMVLDTWSKTIFFVMGDGRTGVAPFSIFESRPTLGLESPNFKLPRIDDWGFTIGFGNYEAATDFILSQRDTVMLNSST